MVDRQDANGAQALTALPEIDAGPDNAPGGPSLRKLPKLLFCLTGLSLLGAAGAFVGQTLWSTEHLMQRQFDRALAAIREPAPPARTAARSDTSVRHGASAATHIAGSEHFWLSSADSIPAATEIGAFKLGAHITIGAAPDAMQILEVVDIRPLDPGPTRVSHGPNQQNLMLVVCRQIAGPGAPGRIMRLVVEAGANEVALPSGKGSAHAL